MPRHSLTSLFFGRRRLPLCDALHLLQSSAEILRRYKSDTHHTPDEEDFALLTAIINQAQYIRVEAMQAYYGTDERLKGNSS